MKQLAIRTHRSSRRSFHGLRSASRSVRGFSLIELLVVIAIIALLAAIIFPVFATVRENGRQQTSLANMHDISTKLAQYKLDHKTYPAILFGRALPVGYPGSKVAPYAPMDQAYAAAQAADAANAAAPAAGYVSAVDTYFDGLYPEYIRDVNSFKDGNNPASNLAAASTMPAVQLNPDSSVSAVNVTLYTVDAFDSSPLITGTNQLDLNTSVLRYSRDWTSITADGSAPAGSTSYAAGETPVDAYKRQLRWQNPPSGTYVTSTTYHISNANKVLVLWENGSAKNLDASLFLATGGGSDTKVSASDGPVLTSARFWQLKP